MADYFKNGPKFLEVDPTRDMPFVKVYDAEYTRGYQCPRVELIDVTHEIKQALLVRFQYATPEHCYACYLEAGSPTLWDIDYVKDVLNEGSKKARAIAIEKIKKAKEIVGLVGNIY